MAKTHEGDWAAVAGGVLALPAAAGAAIFEACQSGSLRQGASLGQEIVGDTARAVGDFGDRHCQTIAEITDVAAEVGKAVLKVFAFGQRMGPGQ